MRRGRLMVATDHAPHLLSECEGIHQPPGTVGTTLTDREWEMADKEIFTCEMVVERMCHAPHAFGLRKEDSSEGYNAVWCCSILSRLHSITGKHPHKCGWSPRGVTFGNSVRKTYVMDDWLTMRAVSDAAGELLILNVESLYDVTIPNRKDEDICLLICIFAAETSKSL